MTRERVHHDKMKGIKIVANDLGRDVVQYYCTAFFFFFDKCDFGLSSKPHIFVHGCYT
jgi:hypothetical protein